MDTGFAALNDKMDAGFASTDKKLDAAEARFTESRTEYRSDVAQVWDYVHNLERRFYDFLVPRPAPTGTEST